MEKKQKTRKGTSSITSVSVSPEFVAYLKEYDLSPTEVFRVGLAVMLSERGVSPYDMSALNSERSKLSKEFLVILEENKQLSDLFDEVAKLNNLIEDIRRK